MGAKMPRRASRVAVAPKQPFDSPDRLMNGWPTLRELTNVAATYLPKEIGKILIELFADVMGGSYDEEESSTAERLFGCMIKQACQSSARQPRKSEAKTAVFAWLPVSDPLRIREILNAVTGW